MYILISIACLYVLFLFLSSEGRAEWVRGKTVQVMNGWQHGMQRMVKEEGQSLTEYGLLLALIAIVCIAILWWLGCYIWWIICFFVRFFGGECGSEPCPNPLPAWIFELLD